MQIGRVQFHRFKQFRDQVFELHDGLSLVAGGNNAGKSSLLHGLAVWEFCRTAIEMERGAERFLPGQGGQGLGLGDDQFSPINVPSLKHLWTNLKTQAEGEADGYTLQIRCEWNDEAASKHLEFGLSLVNDRLFVKATDSNLEPEDAIPRIAYLPPFAGITDREMRVTGAIRRRRIGEGLAGAVLRNLLLDMWQHNERERVRLRGARTKISDADLRRLRETDPWEMLQQTLRETFGTELLLTPFREEYHSYLQVEIVKGTVDRYKLKRHPNFAKRDLMVEGSGFLQWLSVYTLATDPTIDILLLDEPDAHLHSSLQEHLLERLRQLADAQQKQVLVATHSTEILRSAAPDDVMQVAGGSGRYLQTEEQKTGLLVGLGSEYAPRIDRLKRTKRLLFVEGISDVRVLKLLAHRLGRQWSDSWVEWRSTSGHRERKHVHRALLQEIPDLVTLSLRDRDDEPFETVGPDLVDQGGHGSFHARRWRRRYLESYLIFPPAIAQAGNLTEDFVRRELQDRHAIAVGEGFTASDAPQGLMDVRAKQILRTGSAPGPGQFDVSAVEVAEVLAPGDVCVDILTLLDDLDRLGA